MKKTRKYYKPEMVECLECQGKGEVWNDWWDDYFPCPTCGGTGEVEGNSQFDVDCDNYNKEK